ncbi:MAG: hypothetical protein ACK5O2_13655 [Microthrixaceae bacterium]
MQQGAEGDYPIEGDSPLEEDHRIGAHGGAGEPERSTGQAEPAPEPGYTAGRPVPTRAETGQTMPAQVVAGHAVEADRPAVTGAGDPGVQIDVEAAGGSTSDVVRTLEEDIAAVASAMETIDRIVAGDGNAGGSTDGSTAGGSAAGGSAAGGSTAEEIEAVVSGDRFAVSGPTPSVD